MNWTPTLANLSLQTNPPGNRFTALLNGILPDTNWSTSMSTILCGIMIIMNIERSDATSRTCTLSHIINRHEPHHFHHQFFTVQWLRLDLNHILLTWFNSRVLTGFDSVFTDSIRTNVFDWIRLSFPTSIWITVFSWIWIRFLVWFDSCLTRLFFIRFTSFD